MPIHFHLVVIKFIEIITMAIFANSSILAFN